MTFSVLRKNFAKDTPKTVLYRCCKRYDQKSFNNVLQNKISQTDLEIFFDVFSSTLDAFGPKNSEIKKDISCSEKQTSKTSIKKIHEHLNS